MFGLPSFSKLLLLAAIIAAVWYGFRIIGQMQKDRDQARKEAENAKKGQKQTTHRAGADDVEEMVKDPKTGAYVPKSSLKDS